MCCGDDYTLFGWYLMMEFYINLYTYWLQECNIGNCHLEKTTVDRNKNKPYNINYKTIYIIVISQNICIVFSMIFVIVLLHVLPLATLTKTRYFFRFKRNNSNVYVASWETVGLIIYMSNNYIFKCVCFSRHLSLQTENGLIF